LQILHRRPCNRRCRFRRDFSPQSCHRAYKIQTITPLEKIDYVMPMIAAALPTEPAAAAVVVRLHTKTIPATTERTWPGIFAAAGGGDPLQL
jgi:hypothetical protein